MKLKKIRKKYHLDLLVTLVVPVSFLVGIISQVSILSQYNAVAGFSWTQVLIDMAIFIPLIFSSLLGGYSYYLLDKLKLTSVEKWRAGIFMFEIIIIFMIFLGIVKYLNTYLIGIVMFFCLGYLTIPSLNTGSIHGKRLPEKYNFAFPTLFLTLVVLVTLLVILFFSLGYQYMYKQVFIEYKGNIYETRYMNDKIIIYGENRIGDRSDKEIQITVNTSLKKIINIK